MILRLQIFCQNYLLPRYLFCILPYYSSTLLSLKLYQNKALKSWLKTNSYSSNKGFGYKRFNLIRASSAVKCHFTPICFLLRSFSQSEIVLFSSSSERMRLFPRHCIVRALSSVSTILSQLPCLGVSNF